MWLEGAPGEAEGMKLGSEAAQRALPAAPKTLAYPLSSCRVVRRTVVFFDLFGCGMESKL